MARQITFSPTSLADFENLHGWIARDSPRAADAMHRQLLADIERLRRYPRTGRPAREQDEVEFELRQLTVFPFRVLYAIRGNDIHVLRVRHGAQDDLSAGEIA